MATKETISIGTRITKVMQKSVEQVLQTDGHVNKADYVRDLIRKDLEKRGLLSPVLKKRNGDKDNTKDTEVY
jgi:Arc/MetJ-type ribon-helix-helix transcriptional regulator